MYYRPLLVIIWPTRYVLKQESTYTDRPLKVQSSYFIIITSPCLNHDLNLSNTSWLPRTDVDHVWVAEGLVTAARWHVHMFTCWHHTWSDQRPGVIQRPESHSVIPTSHRQSRELYTVLEHPPPPTSDWSWVSEVTFSLVVRCPLTLTFIMSWLKSVLLINTFSKGVIQCQMSTTRHCLHRSSWAKY